MPVTFFSPSLPHSFCFPGVSRVDVFSSFLFTVKAKKKKYGTSDEGSWDAQKVRELYSARNLIMHQPAPCLIDCVANWEDLPLCLLVHFLEAPATRPDWRYIIQLFLGIKPDCVCLQAREDVDVTHPAAPPPAVIL